MTNYNCRLKVPLLALIICLVACSGSSDGNEEPKESDRYRSGNYDYKNEHQFISPSFGKADSLAVDLCDCVVSALDEIDYSTELIIDLYDKEIASVYGVDDGASFFCGYLSNWKNLYNKRELDSIMDNYILDKDSVVGAKVIALKEKLGLIKALNVIRLYEYNCKVTAPYSRMNQLISKQDIYEYTCQLKTEGLITCFNIVINEFPKWYYNEVEVEEFGTFVNKHCPN